LTGLVVTLCAIAALPRSEAPIETSAPFPVVPPN
jgi:hypothetical protein